MKLTILFLLLPLFFIVGCKKPVEPSEPVEPPVPYIKAGQVYALINGEEWKSCRRSPLYPPATAQNRDGQWELEAVNSCSGGSVYFYISDWLREGTYHLSSIQGNYALYWREQEYFTSQQYTGTITITRIDSVTYNTGHRAPAYLSGEFSFRALGEDSTTVVEVMEGIIKEATISN